MERQKGSNFSDAGSKLSENGLCEECSLYFKTNDELAKHKMHHHTRVMVEKLDSSDHYCPFCELFFVSSSAHIKSGCKKITVKHQPHNNNDNNSDYSIDFTLNTDAIRLSTKPISSKCKYCGEHFDTCRNLWKHLISNHALKNDAVATVERNVNNRKYYFCPLCNQSCFGFSGVMQHIGKKHLYCKSCSILFHDIRLFFEHYIECSNNGSSSSSSSDSKNRKIFHDDDDHRSSITSTGVPCLICRRPFKTFVKYLDHTSRCDTVRNSWSPFSRFDHVNNVDHVHYTCDICNGKDNSCCLDTHLRNYHSSNEDECDSIKKERFKSDDELDEEECVLNLTMEDLIFENPTATVQTFVEELRNNESCDDNNNNNKLKKPLTIRNGNNNKRFKIVETGNIDATNI